MLVACATEPLRDPPPSDVLDLIRDVGIRAVELAIPLSEFRQTAATQNIGMQPDLWNEQIALRGMRVASVSLRAAGLSPPAFAGAMFAAITAAKKFDASVVVACIRDVQEMESSHQLSLTLRHLGNEADQSDVTIALDFRGAADADSRSMLELVDSVDHQSVRLSFDTGGYLLDNPGSSGEVALQRVCAHIAHLRLSDHSGSESDDEFPPLGEAGGVDFARTLQILSNVGFAGPCVIQLQPRRFERAAQSQWQDWLGRSVSHLRGCGWPLDD